MILKYETIIIFHITINRCQYLAMDAMASETVEEYGPRIPILTGG